MKSRSRRPAPSHSSASAPRFASFSARTGNAGRAEPRRRARRRPARPSSRGSGRSAGGRVESTRPGSATTAPTGRRPLRCARSKHVGRPGGRGRRAPRRPRGRGCRPRRGRRGAPSPRRSTARTARKSTPTSSPRPMTLRPSSSTGSAGRPTVPSICTSVSRTRPAVEQLADEARDRRLVEPGALGDRRPGARPALGDVAQDHAQVVPADGALVRWDAAGIVGLHGPTLTRTAAPRSTSYRSVERVGERDLGRGERGVGRDELERLRAGEPVAARERAIGHQRVDVGGDVEAERRLVRLLAVRLQQREEPARALAVRVVVGPDTRPTGSPASSSIWPERSGSGARWKRLIVPLGIPRDDEPRTPQRIGYALSGTT